MSILSIVLETTGKVATDYEQLHTGKMRMPSGGELVEQVYDGVVFPVMERVVAKAFGFVGGPILWTYRRTVGLAVRTLVKRVNSKVTNVEQEQDIATSAKEGLAAIAKYSDTINTYTSSAAQYVEGVGSTIRFYAMLPLYVLFAISLALATIPILVVRFVVAG